MELTFKDFLILATGPVLWLIAIVIYVAIIVPVFIIRFLVLKLWDPTEEDEESSIFPDPGFVFLGTQTSKTSPSVLVGYTQLEGDISLEELRRKFLSNVIMSRNAESGTLNYPRYRQYVDTTLGFNLWKWDRNFDIDNHIYELEGTQGKSVTTEDEIIKLMGPLANKAFKPKQPLWEYLYVRNYVPKYDTQSKPRTLVIYRIHHGLCDGYSLVKCFVQHTCGDSLDKIMKPATSSSRKRPSLYEQAVTIGAHVAAMPYSFMRQYLTVDFNVWFPGRSKLTRECILGMTKRMPIRLVKQVSKENGVSFSTVLFSIVGGGMRRFFKRKYFGQEQEFPIPESFQCFTAFPRPNHPDSQLVNHW